MLEIRPNCECCGRELSPDDADVYICSFECTWCSGCVERFPGPTCPNCGGTLEHRPIRPPELLRKHPPSTRRRLSAGMCGRG